MNLPKSSPQVRGKNLEIRTRIILKIYQHKHHPRSFICMRQGYNHKETIKNINISKVQKVDYEGIKDSTD